MREQCRKALLLIHPETSSPYVYSPSGGDRLASGFGFSLLNTLRWVLVTKGVLEECTKKPPTLTLTLTVGNLSASQSLLSSRVPVVANDSIFYRSYTALWAEY